MPVGSKWNKINEAINTESTKTWYTIKNHKPTYMLFVTSNKHRTIVDVTSLKPILSFSILLWHVTLNFLCKRSIAYYAYIQKRTIILLAWKREMQSSPGKRHNLMSVSHPEANCLTAKMSRKSVLKLSIRIIPSYSVRSNCTLSELLFWTSAVLV